MSKKTRDALIFVVLCISINGCVAFPTPTETEERIFGVMLQVSDFPSGWRHGRGIVENVEGATSRSMPFRGSPDTEKYSVLVTHQISVYDSVPFAQQAYPALKREWFPTTDWIVPSELPYHSDVADQFWFACASSSVNGVPVRWCRAVGQYNDMTSILLANVFEDQWFTWEDMEHVLKAIDERMAAEMQ